MDRNIKISVIVPVYNVEEYVNDCIECFRKQTYSNFEVIFVNDGSKDSSGRLLDIAAEKDSRFKVIHKENGGAAEARNYGLEYCSGEYICFVDADDLFVDKYLEILLNAALENDCDIVQCAYRRINNRKIKEEVSSQDSTGQIQIVSNVEMLNNIYSPLYIDTIVLWNKIYRKTLFDKERFPVGIMFEDEVTSAKVAFKASRIGLIAEPLYYYYYNEQSVMNQKYSYKKLDILIALKLRMDFYKENNLIELYQKDCYKYLYKILQNYYLLHHNMPEDKQVKRELMSKYWNKYKETIYFSWTLKRKIAMFIFGLFPLSYTRYYERKKKD